MYPFLEPFLDQHRSGDLGVVIIFATLALAALVHVAARRHPVLAERLHIYVFWFTLFAGILGGRR